MRKRRKTGTRSVRSSESAVPAGKEGKTARRRARAAERKRRRRIVVLVGAVAGVAIIATAMILWRVFPLRDPPVMHLVGFSDEQAGFARQFIQEMESDFGQQLNVYGDEQSKPDEPSEPDIIITLKGSPTLHHPNDLAAISSENLGLMPRSLRRLSYVENTPKLLPVALDHVELTYNRDVFARFGGLIDGRVVDLAALETVLAGTVGADFVPLMVAGANDRTLLDFVSVLALSLGGVDRYNSLVAQAGELEETEATEGPRLLETETLEQATDLIRRWRSSGYLHPQWLSFSNENVLDFVQLERTAVVVMRLSTHRTWPFHILRRWRSSPFPYVEAAMAGTGLIAPVYVAAVPAESLWIEEAGRFVPHLVKPEFQEAVVSPWRLGPVNSTAQGLDRESSDLRFWAAASSDILPSIATVLSVKQQTELAEQLRQRLSR